jgi:mRNA interferase MazF
MKRGDLVTVVMPGAYGKPRPAVIVQADQFAELDSVTFLPLTSEIVPDQVFRILATPSATNGLQAPSHIMVDKCTTLPLTKFGPVFGRLSKADMTLVNRALAVFLEFSS